MKQMIRHYLELIRFSHTVFAMPFALLAAVLAWSRPDTEFRVRDLVGIVLCMVAARSAAMAFNRLVDRRIDAGNPRTATRHLPAGLLSVRSVVGFTVFSSLVFILSTLIFLPRQLPLFLSVPVLLFLLGYSLSKRFTSLCHYWLSAALMLSPIAAWIAIRNEFALAPTLLGGVLFFWVGGFDILYACQDAEFDRTEGLRSIPSKIGIPNALKLAAFSHLLTIVMLIAVWQVLGLSLFFLAGVLAIAALLIWEHLLVRPDDLTRINIAFFNINAVISFGILILGCLDIWLFSSPQ
ncbi:MAG: UbiA-like polyprenyltransferase [Planctomycetaceae bacterium]